MHFTPARVIAASGVLLLLLALPLAGSMGDPGAVAPVPASTAPGPPSMAEPEARAVSGDRPAAGADSALLVLAAASLTDVLPRVAEVWERDGGVPIRFSFDATSRLAPQALQGAPADLFFSADEEWMDWVGERDGLLPDTRVDLLENALVVVVPAGGSFLPRGPAGLLDPAVRHLAVAGENVPAGRYAQAALESSGVWGAVRGRVVRAGNVRGALEWVALGEAQAGIVYRTDAQAEPRVRVAFAFPPESHPSIVYPAAVLRRAPLPQVARAFLAFCQSRTGGQIFRGEGFSLLGGPATPSVPPEPPGAASSRVEGSAASSRLSLWSAIRLSFLVAFVATIVGFAPAVWLGWTLARRDFFGKSVLATVILVPLVLPPVVTGFLLLSLLGAQSPLGAWLAAIGVPVPFTLLGAILAAFAVGLPLYVVSVRNAFQTVDPAYEEVSWTLGHRPAPTFLRVTFPLALPGIAAGAVLAFARALGEFGATVVLAGNVEGHTRTIALAVYTLLESPQGRGAIWLLVGASVSLSLLALLGYEILSRRQRRQMELLRGR